MMVFNARWSNPDKKKKEEELMRSYEINYFSSGLKVRLSFCKRLQSRPPQ